jgi:hypothetical protein
MSGRGISDDVLFQLCISLALSELYLVLSRSDLVADINEFLSSVACRWASQSRDTLPS